MASSNSFIHIDLLGVAAFVWPAGFAVDSGLEMEEEFKEMEGDKAVTLLTMWLSVKNEDELVVLVIFGEKWEFSVFHRSLDFIGRSAAPLIGLRQVALQDKILQSLYIHKSENILMSWSLLIFTGITNHS